jgi:hypothetical protein
MNAVSPSGDSAVFRSIRVFQPVFHPTLPSHPGASSFACGVFLPGEECVGEVIPVLISVGKKSRHAPGAFASLWG